MKAHDAIIPTRFMSSMSFLVSTLMVFSTSAENIVASLPKTYAEASFNANETSLYFALAVTIICIGINLFGFMAGFSMFLHGPNVAFPRRIIKLRIRLEMFDTDALNLCYTQVLVVISHTVGTLYACVFIMEGWHYLTFWYISVFCAIPVALLEVIIILGTFCLGGINRV